MFHVSLDLPSKLPAELGEFDWDSDDFPSLAMEACTLLGSTDCRFRIGGFGQEDWDFDIRYDMSSVIEQLPEMLTMLRAGADVELDLYTPGIERTIAFAIDGTMISAECRSRTAWVPMPPVERHDRVQLVSMFENLAVDFARAVDMAYPEMAESEPLNRWRLGYL